ncbi:LysR family transcriptional regulator [Nocardioides litoris]|uniref:LysR family transcriptional regulator n=1 Tax=Nocardioides litoris TaxID=1926648 RepID=UPI001122952B|nr:LysR family transcriptional regulator [Nocardioides litoris]
MDVRHLELLRALADHGTVTAVARATHRTPSAVSQQLRTASREAGTPLVERHGRGLRLTDAGRLLADGAHDVARALAQVQARLDELRHQPTGTVSVAALPSVATFLLPPVLAELEGTGVDLEVTDVDLPEARYPRLTRDHDLVVGHSLSATVPAGVPELICVELVREPLDIALRPGHPLAARSVLRPADLVDVEWYGVPLGFPFDAVRLAVEEATGAPVRVVQRLRDNRLVEALVAGSDRVAVLPRFTTHPGARVELRPLVGVTAARHVYAYARPDRAERLACRRVLDALQGAAAAAATP